MTLGNPRHQEHTMDDQEPIPEDRLAKVINIDWSKVTPDMIMTPKQFHERLQKGLKERPDGQN